MATPLSLDVPHSTSRVSVSIIDTTITMPFPIRPFFNPIVGGVEQLEAIAYSFLVEHPNGQKLLFDLGARVDFESNAPALVRRLKSFGFAPAIEKDVATILNEGGMNLGDISAVIWSHHHWDHVGDVSKFPSTTELVVGPGVPTLWPGYPVNQDSFVLESDYKGRPTREIDFNDGLKIGGFRAFDYFGDGSFYLLDAPGHTIGHMNALARTTVSPPSFIFMGGDTCHHAGVFRPTEYLPIPETIIPSPLSPLNTTQISSFCPGDMFLSLHPIHSPTEPFYKIAVDEKGQSLAYVDVKSAKDTIVKMQRIDSYEDVLVIMAHDASLRDVLSYWPKLANTWQEEGWKSKGTWRFLADFVKKDGAETRL